MALLTIAIPTYNRAEHVERQLTFLSKELAGNEADCELFVSDNASPDDTPGVLGRWAAELEPRLRFRVNRNAHNCGVMRNIAMCLTEAATEFVWVVGDDDDLEPGILDRILDELRAHPDLHLLGLNYSMHRVTTGELMAERRYELGDDVVKPGPGPLLAQDATGTPLVPGLGFMTAQVYRSDSIRAAVRSWPGYDNYEIQIYWGGHCACRGAVRILRDVYVRYACGDNVLAIRKNWYKARTCDAPMVYTRLLRLGYGPTFTRDLILSPVTANRELRTLVTGFWRWPHIGVASLSVLASGYSALQAPPDMAPPAAHQAVCEPTDSSSDPEEPTDADRRR
jgi:glycosyltransferase involved in cell wall biosynthesis